MKVFRGVLPYPTIDDEGNLLNGIDVEQPKACKTKCRDKKCRNFCSDTTEAVKHFICPTGFSVFVMPVDKTQLRINGVYDPNLNSDFPAHLKKACRSNRVTLSQVSRYFNGMTQVVSQTNEVINQRVVESLSSLHDVRTLAGLVLKNAELLNSTCSTLLQDSFELKALLNAADLLKDHLSILDVVANPERKSLGNITHPEVYKLVTKIVKCFRGITNEQKQFIDLKITSNNRVEAYQTIHLVPLVLIDNAIKYHLGNHNIEISVEDVGRDAVRLSVKSYGPLIEGEWLELVYRKFIRGPQAAKFSQKGGGVGLYIGQEIAKAHNTKIRYTGEYCEKINGARCGWNNFEVVFRVKMKS